MSVLEILKFPDPNLRKKSVPVDGVDDELRQLADDMLETMYYRKGIGLAAPQVNRQVRLLVIDTQAALNNYKSEGESQTELEKKIHQPIVIFNPKIVKVMGKTSYSEGCLSVPGYYEDVNRADWVRAEGLDRAGQQLIIETDGLLAICLQHELDHLDGKLFIDRLSPIKATRIRSKIKKFGYEENKLREKHEVL